MATNPTVAGPRKAAKVNDQEIDAEVDAVLADLATESHPLANLLNRQRMQHEAYQSAMVVLRKPGPIASEAAEGPVRNLAAWLITEGVREQLTKFGVRKMRRQDPSNTLIVDHDIDFDNHD